MTKLYIKPMTPQRHEKDKDFLTKNNMLPPTLKPNETIKVKNIKYQRIGDKILRITENEKIQYQAPYYFIQSDI